MVRPEGFEPPTQGLELLNAAMARNTNEALRFPMLAPSKSPLRLRKEANGDVGSGVVASGDRRGL
jgi:hypothetical protein